MKKIEFTTAVKVADKDVTSIEVAPLLFVEMAEIWRKAGMQKNAATALQRERIRFQAHFMAGDTRVTPTDIDILSLPLGVAKSIIAALDANSGGKAGKIILEGDGVFKPAIFKLGTPIAMMGGDGGGVNISELEFKAATYGDVEDALAADTPMEKTLELLRRVAKPIDAPQLLAMPAWAIDKITVADGLAIMRAVSPLF